MSGKEEPDEKTEMNETNQELELSLRPRTMSLSVMRRKVIVKYDRKIKLRMQNSPWQPCQELFQSSAFGSGPSLQQLGKKLGGNHKPRELIQQILQGKKKKRNFKGSG